jgi:uncharacterized protein
VAITVRDQPDQSRYEIWDDDQLAGFTRYEHDGDRLAFVHTEVGDEFEGRGLAKRLVAETLDDVRRRGLQILPYCPFVARFLRKNPDYQDLVPDDERARFALATTSRPGR